MVANRKKKSSAHGFLSIWYGKQTFVRVLGFTTVRS